MSSSFRITQRTMSAGVMSNLQGNLGRMQQLQEQLSSGKAISKPSDSPTDTVSALRYRADIRRSEQLARNAQDGLGWLGTADNTLTSSLSVVQRARELVLQGGTATSGASARDAIAAEVDGLRQNLISLANTPYLNRPIFGGTNGGDVAYTTAGAYTGTPGVTQEVERTVAPGVTVQVNLGAEEVFGPAGADVFKLLEDISAHLRSSDTTQVAMLTDEDLGALDDAMDRILNAVSTVGARYHQVETMFDRTQDGILQLTNGLAEVESIDLPKTITDLKLQEVSYQAALSATARVIQPSLVDFLR
jgi:flagellar hook-associated protein 3 FlgL